MYVYMSVKENQFTDWLLRAGLSRILSSPASKVKQVDLIESESQLHIFAFNENAILHELLLTSRTEHFQRPVCFTQFDIGAFNT